MLIDWFTVIAQIINFLALIWLLKRFLYKPILRAMATREKTIADNLAAATDAKAMADSDRLDLARQHQELQSTKVALLAQATTQAETEYQILLTEARRQVEIRQAEWYRSLAMEQEAFLTELQSQVQIEIFALARQLLHDLADSELEERIAASFLRHFAQLPALDKDRLLAASHAAPQSLRLRSAFVLSETIQTRIIHTLHEEIALALPIDFEVVPDLIGGIELAIGGEKLAWSLDNYLLLLRQRMEELLERTKTDASEE